MRGWTKIKGAAEYAGMSERSLRPWLKPGKLRHVRLPSSTILIKYSWIDAFLKRFEVSNDDKKAVEDIVNDVCRELK